MSVILKPERGGRPIVLDKPILLVGRHPDCDVIIKDSPKISRKHCCIALVDHRFVVRDLDSMNGVWVNNNRVTHSHDLLNGDRLIIGDVPFAVISMGVAKARPAQEPGTGTDSLVDPEFARDVTLASEPEDSVDNVPPAKSKSVDKAGPNDVVEFSSAFAVPLTDSSEGGDFMPLADGDE